MGRVRAGRKPPGPTLTAPPAHHQIKVHSSRAPVTPGPDKGCPHTQSTEKQGQRPLPAPARGGSAATDNPPEQGLPTRASLGGPGPHLKPHLPAPSTSGP